MRISVRSRWILSTVAVATVVLCGFLLLVSTCEIGNFDPSFANFVEEATAPELRLGFFEYEVSFPVDNGVEETSSMMLVSAESGENVLPYPMPGGWILDAPTVSIEDGEYRSIRGSCTVECGMYSFSVIIANPASTAMVTRNVLLSPGEPTAYKIDLTPADFEGHLD